MLGGILSWPPGDSRDRSCAWVGASAKLPCSYRNEETESDCRRAGDSPRHLLLVILAMGSFERDRFI